MEAQSCLQFIWKKTENRKYIGQMKPLIQNVGNADRKRKVVDLKCCREIGEVLFLNTSVQTLGTKFCDDERKHVFTKPCAEGANTLT